MVRVYVHVCDCVSVGVGKVSITISLGCDEYSGALCDLVTGT